ncbi:MAG: phosphatidylglycerophosphatase A [Bacteroidetes bacterium]|nr:phosphatidylglycerophosphatase A [Bacteroidota bacterium]
MYTRLQTIGSSALTGYYHVLGTVAFFGHAPFASGTVGSAVALAAYWFLPFTGNGTLVLLVALSFLFLGIPAAASLERRYGDDPSVVVLDEAVGMWIALAYLPKIWYITIGAFLLFRLFDIVKPQPARYFDNMHGGGGIMMDDVIAAVYANLIMQIIIVIL